MNKKNESVINDFYNKDTSYKDQDFLGFSNAKDSFMKVITEIKPPVTIGLYGTWGSGKSWMIEGLKQDLENKNNLVITFDAWKYRHEKNLVLPILYKLSKDYSQKKSGLQKSIKRVISGVGLSAANIGLRLATQGRAGLSDVKEALHTAEQGETEFDKYSDNIESLEKKYKEVIEWILEKQSKEKMIIFIDNLDRCLPDIVVDLLEDISSFLSIQNVPCIYVLAMDKANVIKAIKHRYPDFDGKHYLEKIVQIALNMPIPQKREDVNSSYALYFFMKRYEKAKGLDVKKDKSTNGDSIDKIYKCLETTVKEVFDSGYLINLRRVERIVNKFIVLEKMTSFDMEKQPEDVPLALFLLLLAEFHPNVYNSLRQEDDYKYLQRIIQMSHQKETPPAWLKKERVKGYLNSNNKDCAISDEYCDNKIFYDLLKAFKTLGNLSAYLDDIQRINDLLLLVG